MEEQKLRRFLGDLESLLKYQWQLQHLKQALGQEMDELARPHEVEPLRERHYDWLEFLKFLVVDGSKMLGLFLAVACGSALVARLFALIPLFRWGHPLVRLALLCLLPAILCSLLAQKDEPFAEEWKHLSRVARGKKRVWKFMKNCVVCYLLYVVCGAVTYYPWPSQLTGWRYVLLAALYSTFTFLVLAFLVLVLGTIWLLISSRLHLAAEDREYAERIQAEKERHEAALERRNQFVPTFNALGQKLKLIQQAIDHLSGLTEQGEPVVSLDCHELFAVSRLIEYFDAGQWPELGGMTGACQRYETEHRELQRQAQVSGDEDITYPSSWRGVQEMGWMTKQNTRILSELHDLTVTVQSTGGCPSLVALFGQIDELIKAVGCWRGEE